MNKCQAQCATRSNAKRSTARALDTCTTYTHNMSVHNTTVRTTLCTNCTRCTLSARHHVVCTVVPSFLEVHPLTALPLRVPHDGSSSVLCCGPSSFSCFLACSFPLPSSGLVCLGSPRKVRGWFLDGPLGEAETELDDEPAARSLCCSALSWRRWFLSWRIFLWIRR